MKAYISGLIIVIQFFSILPITKEIPMTPKNLDRAVRMFPVFGMFLGLAYSGVLYGLLQGTPFSPLAVAFCLWLLPIVLTGGIHLDGWMDSCDAYFSYRDVHKRLEILKDPRIGAFGVLSVIVPLGARFLFIYEIILLHTPLTYLLVGVIPVLSRMAMGMMLRLVPVAKQSGLGYTFQQACTSTTLWNYWIILVPVLIVLFAFSSKGGLLVMLMFAGTLILFLGLRKKAVKWFGGITGDIVGASVEGVEVYLWMMVWLFHYFAMG